MKNITLLIGFTLTLYIFLFLSPTQSYSLNYIMEYTPAGFNPASLSTRVGDTLTISNQSDILLDLYSAPSTSQIQTQALNVATIEPGATFSITFTTSRSHLFFNLKKPDTFSKLTVHPTPETSTQTDSQTQGISGDSDESGIGTLDSTSGTTLEEYNNTSTSTYAAITQMITQNTQKLVAIIPYFRYVFYVTFTISLILTIGFIQHLFFLKSKRSHHKRIPPPKTR